MGSPGLLNAAGVLANAIDEKLHATATWTDVNVKAFSIHEQFTTVVENSPPRAFAETLRSDTFQDLNVERIFHRTLCAFPHQLILVDESSNRVRPAPRRKRPAASYRCARPHANSRSESRSSPVLPWPGECLKPGLRRHPATRRRRL